MNKTKIQDIEVNISALKGNKLLAHIHSFLCLWYPFKGSVEEHAKYLEKLKKKLRKK